jgi:hypothetical protein
MLHARGARLFGALQRNVFLPGMVHCRGARELVVLVTQWGGAIVVVVGHGRIESPGEGK